EIIPVTINGDPAGDKIVAAAFVLVMKTAITVVVAVEGIPDRVAVFDFDAGPIPKISINLDPMPSDYFGDRADALRAADIFRHLHVVIVGVSVLHRLKAAVELGIVLVHKEIRAVPTHELSGGASRRRVFPGSPF